jgi:hypothetical protein
MEGRVEPLELVLPALPLVDAAAVRTALALQAGQVQAVLLPLLQALPLPAMIPRLLALAKSSTPPSAVSPTPSTNSVRHHLLFLHHQVLPYSSEIYPLGNPSSNVQLLSSLCTKVSTVVLLL